MKNEGFQLIQFVLINRLVTANNFDAMKVVVSTFVAIGTVEELTSL